MTNDILNKVAHDFVYWNGEEHMDSELLIVDKYNDRIIREYGKPIYYHVDLDTKIYEVFNTLKSSPLWKLPIVIEIGIDLEEKEILSISVHY